MFFFFKQKTAYEMRISDWSSDVCSSDLAIRAEAPLLEKAGVCVMMHSDSPADGQRLNIAAAKAAAAGRRVGIDTPPETMMKWTTSNPAKLLGLDKRIGTIAPGFQADVVLWSGDPFSIHSRADLRSEEHPSELQSLM